MQNANNKKRKTVAHKSTIAKQLRIANKNSAKYKTQRTQNTDVNRKIHSQNFEKTLVNPYAST